MIIDDDLIRLRKTIKKNNGKEKTLFGISIDSGVPLVKVMYLSELFVQEGLAKKLNANNFLLL